MQKPTFSLSVVIQPLGGAVHPDDFFDLVDRLAMANRIDTASEIITAFTRSWGLHNVAYAALNMPVPGAPRPLLSVRLVPIGTKGSVDLRAQMKCRSSRRRSKQCGHGWRPEAAPHLNLRKGQAMIRLVTYRNFPLLDLQMEEAYRRRRIAGEFVFLERIDGAILGAPGQSPERFANSQDWLRRLERAVDALAQNSEGLAGRRRKACGLVAANASTSPRRGKRRKRACSR
jgi:hypothetical protein